MYSYFCDILIQLGQKSSFLIKLRIGLRIHSTGQGVYRVSIIIHKPKGVEYHVIYHMKATVFVYVLILSNKI